MAVGPAALPTSVGIIQPPTSDLATLAQAQKLQLSGAQILAAMGPAGDTKTHIGNLNECIDEILQKPRRDSDMSKS